MKDMIDALQGWYALQCDGVWEHSFGIEIANIDNPGWKVKITGATARKPIGTRSERSESDWVMVDATDTAFIAFGGAQNLKELLMLAVDWLE